MYYNQDYSDASDTTGHGTRVAGSVAGNAVGNSGEAADTQDTNLNPITPYTLNPETTGCLWGPPIAN